MINVMPPISNQTVEPIMINTTPVANMAADINKFSQFRISKDFA